MEIFIDGDGCPVIEETERAAALYGLKVVIFCDTSHLIHSETSRVMVVDKGRDAADWAIISAAHPGDVVITQDYGLASLVLSRRAYAFHQDGWQYTEDNKRAFFSSAMKQGKQDAQRSITGKGRRKGKENRMKSFSSVSAIFWQRE